MKKIMYLIPIAIIIIIIIAYGQITIKKTDEGMQVDKNEEVKEQNVVSVSTTSLDNKEVEHIGGEEHGAELAGTRIVLQNLNNLKLGEVILSFKLYGIDAHEFKSNDLEISSEKLMHLILVRDDMQYYQHLHPEFVDDRWVVKTQISQQGNYEMYVDINPKEEKPTVLRVPLVIGGNTEKRSFPSVSDDLSTMVDDISVSLDPSVLTKTNEKVILKFKLTKNNQPINKIGTYLGALGHVVILQHGKPNHFSHAHPLNGSTLKDGFVEFETEFNSKGMYTVYAEFNIDDKIKIFPITLELDGSGDMTNPKDAKMNDDSHMR